MAYQRTKITPLQCVLSLGCNLCWAGALAAYYNFQGFHCLLVHYLVPLFVFGCWLVITTFLHHQGEDVPWYCDEKWDYVRGQLSSVDRDYGWAHSLTHNIGTHQVYLIIVVGKTQLGFSCLVIQLSEKKQSKYITVLPAFGGFRFRALL